MTLNGALAGLVAITAPCATVSPSSAIIIGIIAGILVVFSVEFIDQKLHIDDPVGAISVHGVCGAWGTLAVGLFSQASFGEASGVGAINGFFFGGGIHQLLVQLLGVVAVFVWTGGSTLLMFYFIKNSVGLRVSRDEELKGLDIGEHGIDAYSGFQIFATE
jgi:Amt family ammonium transporter